MTDKTETPIDFEAAHKFASWGLSPLSESAVAWQPGFWEGVTNLARAYLSLAAEVDRLRAENAALRANQSPTIDAESERWFSGHVRCVVCGHRWLAIAPVSGESKPRNLECPACGNMEGFPTKEALLHE